jgi:hypothetical protein
MARWLLWVGTPAISAMAGNPYCGKRRNAMGTKGIEIVGMDV